jgi:peptidoglycan/xylan/chitin deacetylase (PgdA/CDA1 family)
MRKVRYLLGETLGYALIYSGIARLFLNARLARGEMTAFYFHNPSAALFEKLMSRASHWGFEFVDANTVLHQLSSGVAPKKPMLFISVDDGWQGNLANMAVHAEKVKIPVCYFISTKPLDTGEFWWCRVKNSDLMKQLKAASNADRTEWIDTLSPHPVRVAMTRDELRELSLLRHASIGNHTHTHPILPSCTRPEIELELAKAHQRLLDVVGKKPTVFAYPNGDYDGREREVLIELGYSMAFTTEPRGILPGEPDLYQLPRFAANEHAGFAENFCRLIGLWQTLYLRFGMTRRISN